MDSLSPGLRVLAGSVPIPQHGVIDLLAADQRGRLALVSFSLEAGHDTVGQAVARWGWATSHLGALRALAPTTGLDFSVEPRVLVIAARATDEARRLAGFIAHPEVELFVATLIAADDRRGILLERAAPFSPPSLGGPPGIDPILSAVPAGEARSLMRRILEEIRDLRFEGEPLRAVGILGGVDLMLPGRLVASLIGTPGGMQVRLVDGQQVLVVDGDAGCRAAVGMVLASAGAEPKATPAAATASAGMTIPIQPAAALTAEEIAEFEKIAGPVEREARPAGQTHTPAPVRVMGARFVEN